MSSSARFVSLVRRTGRWAAVLASTGAVVAGIGFAGAAPAGAAPAATTSAAASARVPAAGGGIHGWTLGWEG